MNNRGPWKGFLSVLFFSSLGVFLSYLLLVFVLVFGTFAVQGLQEDSMLYSLILLVFGFGTPVALLGVSAYAAATSVYNNCIRDKKETPKLVPWMTAAGYLIAHAIGVAILLPIVRDPVEWWAVSLALVALVIGAIATYYLVNQMMKGNIQPMLG